MAALGDPIHVGVVLLLFLTEKSKALDIANWCSVRERKTRPSDMRFSTSADALDVIYSTKANSNECKRI